MPELGQKLKAEREKRKLTASEVAAATHIKVQLIEAIERDDFSRMAAAAYAKGFIKLYAEFLEVDPAPLLLAYAEMNTPGSQSFVSEAADIVSSVSEGEDGDRATPRWQYLLRRVSWPRVALVLGCAVIALFLFSAVSRFVRIFPDRSARQSVSEEKDAPPAIVQEPPAPYIQP